MTGNAHLIEEMRWQLKQIEDRKADNQRLLSAVTPDRCVTVVTGPDGVVSEVRLAPEAMRSDAGALSRAITAAIREATAGKPPPADEEEPYDTVFDV
ncbi:YbaB/EbfC family DNA-binding protein [Amycolatopsis sp. cg9]|uniref:YbaB/EbfC family DNA-binding protein n=1 Tax=Amycolatopsis sp. cg9 TaxID=3238801 RepID=UPI0035255C3A